jgi:hypothetical protein
MGLIAKSPARIVEERTPKSNFNADLDFNMALETPDAQMGALFLILGFAGRPESAAGSSTSSTWKGFVAAVFAALVADVIGYLVLRLRWRPTGIRRVLAARLERKDHDGWWPLLAAYGEALGRESDGGALRLLRRSAVPFRRQ